jgi:hypothetical protein
VVSPVFPVAPVTRNNAAPCLTSDGGVPVVNGGVGLFMGLCFVFFRFG